MVRRRKKGNGNEEKKVFFSLLLFFEMGGVAENISALSFACIKAAKVDFECFSSPQEELLALKTRFFFALREKELGATLPWL